MVDSEGFAQPWLDFEKQIGKRLHLRGPTIDDILGPQYAAIGAALVAKLTFPPGDASVKTENREISPNGLKIRIYTPPGYASSKPVCVFFHSGGWAMGSTDDEDAPLRTIAKNAGVVIVSVDYRLAPANPYPAPLDDCLETYRWALKNTALLNTTPGKAIVFGTSAGANLALGVAFKLIDGKEADTLVGVIAVVPPTIVPEAIPEELKSKYTSYDECSEKTINTREGMKAFSDAYGGDPKDPYVSPLLHKRIKDLPKTYVSVCTLDTLRDDGRLFKAKLDEAGVPNLYDEYVGYPHYFWSYPSEHLARPTAEYFKNMKKAFEFVLS